MMRNDADFLLGPFRNMPVSSAPRWTRCAHTRQVCRAEGAPVLLRSGTALTRILAASRMRSACPSRVGTSLPAAPCLHNRNFNFSSLLCAVGNLEREALPAEAAQRKRFVTRDELMSLAASYRDIDTRRARHPRSMRASACSAVPEPVWMAGKNSSLYMNDMTSRFSLRKAVDVTRTDDASKDWLREAQRQWVQEQLLASSSAANLRDRWVYLMGDSTLRQQLGVLFNELRRQARVGARPHDAPPSDISFEQLKSIARGQARDTGEAIGGAANDSGGGASGGDGGFVQCRTLQQPIDWEYRYPGPSIGSNEMTSAWRLPGANLTITFDWKQCAHPPGLHGPHTMSRAAHAYHNTKGRTAETRTHAQARFS